MDDRLEVLSYLSDVEHRYLFRPRPAEVDAYRRFLDDIQVVDSWPALVEAITGAGRGDGSGGEGAV